MIQLITIYSISPTSFGSIVIYSPTDGPNEPLSRTGNWCLLGKPNCTEQHRDPTKKHRLTCESPDNNLGCRHGSVTQIRFHQRDIFNWRWINCQVNAKRTGFLDDGCATVSSRSRRDCKRGTLTPQRWDASTMMDGSPSLFVTKQGPYGRFTHRQRCNIGTRETHDKWSCMLSPDLSEDLYDGVFYICVPPPMGTS